MNTLLSSGHAEIEHRINEINRYGEDFHLLTKVFIDANAELDSKAKSEQRISFLDELISNFGSFVENAFEGDRWRLEPLFVELDRVTPLARAIKSWRANEVVDFDRFLDWRNGVIGNEKYLLPERAFLVKLVSSIKNSDQDQRRLYSYRLKKMIGRIGKTIDRLDQYEAMKTGHQ